MADVRAYIKEGEQVMANSLPVVVASDQTAIPVNSELPG